MRIGFKHDAFTSLTNNQKATNVSLNPALLSEPKQLNINLSATFEKALREEVAVRKQALWLAENNAAIDFLMTGV